MQYRIVFTVASAICASTVAAHAPHGQAPWSPNSMITVVKTIDAPAVETAAPMEVNGVETVTAEDHYVAFGQPVVTKTVGVADPQATVDLSSHLSAICLGAPAADYIPSQIYDIRQCLAEGKSADACEYERADLARAVIPDIQTGACWHHEGMLHYTYFLSGSGNWQGAHCTNIENAVRKIHMNHVSDFKCKNVDQPIHQEMPTGEQFEAQWEMYSMSRKAVDKALKKIPGAPRTISCKDKRNNFPTSGLTNNWALSGKSSAGSKSGTGGGF